MIQMQENTWKNKPITKTMQILLKVPKLKKKLGKENIEQMNACENVGNKNSKGSKL